MPCLCRACKRKAGNAGNAPATPFTATLARKANHYPVAIHYFFQINGTTVA